MAGKLLVIACLVAVASAYHITADPENPVSPHCNFTCYYDAASDSIKTHHPDVDSAEHKHVDGTWTPVGRLFQAHLLGFWV